MYHDEVCVRACACLCSSVKGDITRVYTLCLYIGKVSVFTRAHVLTLGFY